MIFFAQNSNNDKHAPNTTNTVIENSMISSIASLQLEMSLQLMITVETRYLIVMGAIKFRRYSILFT